ncbi:hypothetical protein B5X24_HaOG201003 [Helicoverpa armigera]|nr:hypothetical protein B5X24_HaOG201003 [Helicoverpa armigera]
MPFYTIFNSRIAARRRSLTTANQRHEIETNEGLGRENVVEKYLQRIFQPLDIMQAIFLSTKYKIRDNIITPIGRIYSFISISGEFGLMIVYYFLYIHTDIWTDNINHFIFGVVDFILYFCGVLLNPLVNVIQKLNNVLLVLKLQNIHRVLNMNENYFKHIIISNWIFSFTVSNFQLLWLCGYYYAFYNIGVDNILTVYICIRFDMNVVYATRTIKLLCKSLEKWTEDLWRSGYFEDSDDQYWDRMFEAFLDTIKAFHIIETIYQQTVGFLNSNHSDLKYGFLTFLSLSWLMKNLTLQTLLSVETERLYAAMREVQSSCILIPTLKQPSVYQRRFYKNIQRVQEISFKKMSMCRLVTVDAELPLRVLHTITTFTIVILQFEFL